jgi:hypothetical protein
MMRLGFFQVPETKTVKREYEFGRQKLNKNLTSFGIPYLFLKVIAKYRSFSLGVN